MKIENGFCEGTEINTRCFLKASAENVDLISRSTSLILRNQDKIKTGLRSFFPCSHFSNRFLPTKRIFIAFAEVVGIEPTYP